MYKILNNLISFGMSINFLADQIKTDGYCSVDTHSNMHYAQLQSILQIFFICFYEIVLFSLNFEKLTKWVNYCLTNYLVFEDNFGSINFIKSKINVDKHNFQAVIYCF